MVLVMNMERKLIDVCIVRDLYIVNGRTASDPEWATTHGSSLVEYVSCCRYVVDCIDPYISSEFLSAYCSITTCSVCLLKPTLSTDKTYQQTWNQLATFTNTSLQIEA